MNLFGFGSMEARLFWPFMYILHVINIFFADFPLTE